MRRILICFLLVFCTTAFATNATSSSGQAQNSGQQDDSRPVIVNGSVPNNGIKAAILEQLRSVYGVGQVVDHLGVGGVASPANWGHFVTK